MSQPPTDPAERRDRSEAIFDATYEPLLAYAARRLPGEADDVVAETLAVCWRRLDDVPEDALPWLYGVARNVVRDATRGMRRRAALAGRLARLAVPRAAPAVDPGTPAVVVALGALPERDREAILLVAWEGLDGERAARAMGLSHAAFRARLHRARAHLRAALEPPPDEPRTAPPRALAERRSDP